MAGQFFDITFGSQVYRNLKFEEVCKIVETYTTAERKAHEDFKKKIDNDNPFISSAHFWSEILGMAKAPTELEWVSPLTLLDSAQSAWRAHLDSWP